MGVSLKEDSFLLYLEDPRPGCYVTIDGHKEKHDAKASHHGWPQLLPQEDQCDYDGERGRPNHVHEQWCVLELLGVNRHQVDDLADSGATPRLAA